MKQRGFLGPIGDDLPSLIPLIFALIIFFASFSSTFQLFDSQSREFNDSIKIMALATTLKGDSYFSAEEFLNSCGKLKAKGIKFKAFLLEDFTSISWENLPHGIKPDEIVGQYRDSPYSDIIVKVLVKDRRTQLVCPVVEDPETIPANARLQVRMYPVAFEDHDTLGGASFVVRPVTLMVIMWKL